MKLRSIVFIEIIDRKHGKTVDNLYFCRLHKLRYDYRRLSRRLRKHFNGEIRNFIFMGLAPATACMEFRWNSTKPVIQFCFVSYSNSVQTHMPMTKRCWVLTVFLDLGILTCRVWKKIKKIRKILGSGWVGQAPNRIFFVCIFFCVYFFDWNLSI